MPKQVDHAEERSRLAEAAWRTIRRGGIDAASVRAVAREAGCSTGPVAHYFRDKDELLVHALRFATAAAARRMARKRASATGLAALRAVLLEALPLDAERREEFRIWLGFWGQAAGDAALTREQVTRYAHWRGLVSECLREARAAGELAAGVDVEAEATALVAWVDGLGIQAFFEPRRFGARWQREAANARLLALANGGGTRRAAVPSRRPRGRRGARR